MVMKFPYSFLVNREKSLSSWAAHSCSAGCFVLSRTWHAVSRRPLRVGAGETYADVVELHGGGCVGVYGGYLFANPAGMYSWGGKWIACSKRHGCESRLSR